MKRTDLNIEKETITRALTYSNYPVEKKSDFFDNIINIVRLANENSDRGPSRNNYLRFNDMYASAVKINCPVGRCYTICGEDYGWPLIRELIEKGEVIEVIEGVGIQRNKRVSPYTFIHDALVFQYNNHIFILSCVDGLPAVIAERELFKEIYG